MNILIRGAFWIDPAQDKKVSKYPVRDIRICDGKIAEIGSQLKEKKEEEIIDAAGLYMMPGLVDLHSHFREPGFESKETIYTGARAALRGGYVASVSMPNTNPPCDQQSVIDNILRKAREVPYNIFPCGTISKKREGKELSEMADLKAAGVVAVSDDGDWVQDSLLMRRAMEYASMLGLIVMSHCEDKRLSAGGFMNEGLVSTRLGLHGIPAASENVAVARDIELARLTGAHLHVCHISTARSVELVRRAREDGMHITAEVTPHNLILTDEAVEGYNTNCKMYPPLRTQQDIDAIRQGLKDGVIDCIATDHAPHTDEDKMAEFDQAPFGTLGPETALPAVVTALYHNGDWSLAEIARYMALAPAQILGQTERFGTIREGMDANLLLFDLDAEWAVSRQDFSSKSRNSCFLGQPVKGKVKMTFCSGRKWIFDREAVK